MVNYRDENHPFVLGMFNKFEEKWFWGTVGFVVDVVFVLSVYYSDWNYDVIIIIE